MATTAETIIIDIQSNYKDGMSPNIETDKQTLDKMQQSLEKMEKMLDKVCGEKNKVKIDADDKATSKITKAKDLLKTIAGKTFKGTVSIVDKATQPLRSILNYATSIKGVITGLFAGATFNKLIAEPIGLADAYSSAKIGFSTLLGESGGQKLMNQIDQFAKATPFKTSNTISQAQRMIAMGWEADNLIADMTTIGDAAAATGKGDEGLQRIVTALAQIKSKGKLSTEELNQLAEAGISAKRYIAEGLGYGSGDKGLMALSEDLQKGAVGAEAAIQAIMNGMKEYNGMMETTANETVDGLKSQIEDTFEINVFRKWGQGLQEGAKRGLGSIVDLLDASEEGLSAFGDQLQDIGSEISGFAADKLKGLVDTLLAVTDSEEFKNADLGGKFSIVWDKVISEPFGKWWDSTGYPWMVDKMSGLGEGLGSGLSDILKGLLGWNSGDMVDDATTIGSGFAKGFLEGFDGSGVMKALSESIKNAITDALKIFDGQGDGSSWLSAALLGYGGIKAYQGVKMIGAVGKGIGQFGQSIYGNLGGTASLKMGQAALPALTQTALGLGAGAGYLTGGLVALDGFKNYRTARRSRDEEKKDAYYKGGSWKLGGVGAGAAAGAAIGSFIPGVGTVIGAGIGALVGGIGGWIKGEKEIDEYNESVEQAAAETRKLKIEQEQAKYESDEMKQLLAEMGPTTEMTAEQLAYFNAQLQKAVNSNITDHFGDMELSLKEIQTLAKKIAFGSNAKALDTFSTASGDAASSLSELESAYEAMDKLNWKASLGLTLDETEMESYKAGIDSVISAAQSYVENKHYEFTAAVSLLLDTSEGSKGESIISGGNEVFAGLQEDIDAYGAELKEAVEKALENGKITTSEMLTIQYDGVEYELNEVEAINKLQQKIQEITDKVNTTMTEAKMETLKIKYSGAEMDSETFQQFQSELMSTVEEATAGYDEALTVSIAQVKLKYNEDGVVTEEEQAAMDAEIAALAEGYNAKIESLEVDVAGFQFNTLAETYATDLDTALAGLDLPGTTATKLANIMKQAKEDGIDVSIWDAETASKYMDLEGLKTGSAEAITQIMADIAKTLPDKFTEGLAGLTDETSGVTSTNLAGIGLAIDSALSSGIKDEDFAGTAGKVTNSTQSAIQTAFDNSTLTADAHIAVTPHLSLTKSTETLNWSGAGMAGSSAINMWVGPNEHANGGFVNGKELSWLGEEGYPEVVIPFAPHRRERALSLFSQTAQMLGVTAHADGGFIGRSIGSLKGRSGNSEPKTATPVSVNLGGVTFEVKTEGNAADIVTQLKSKSAEVSNILSQMLAEALSESFENTPLAE